MSAKNTVNLRNPVSSTLPSNGTLLTSPGGVRAHIAGSSDKLGKVVVVFHVDGRNRAVDMWPTELRGWKHAKGEI